MAKFSKAVALMTLAGSVPSAVNGSAAKAYSGFYTCTSKEDSHVMRFCKAFLQKPATEGLWLKKPATDGQRHLRGASGGQAEAGTSRKNIRNELNSSADRSFIDACEVVHSDFGMGFHEQEAQLEAAKQSQVVMDSVDNLDLWKSQGATQAAASANSIVEAAESALLAPEAAVEKARAPSEPARRQGGHTWDGISETDSSGEDEEPQARSEDDGESEGLLGGSYVDIPEHPERFVAGA